MWECSSRVKSFKKSFKKLIIDSNQLKNLDNYSLLVKIHISDLTIWSITTTSIVLFSLFIISYIIFLTYSVENEKIIKELDEI